MSRTTMTAAFAVILAASMPIAYAADTNTAATPPTVTTTVHTSVPVNHIMPGQIRATQMNGATVYDAQGKNIGDIKDMQLPVGASRQYHPFEGQWSERVSDVGPVAGPNIAAEHDNRLRTPEVAFGGQCRLDPRQQAGRHGRRGGGEQGKAGGQGDPEAEAPPAQRQ